MHCAGCSVDDPRAYWWAKVDHPFSQELQVLLMNYFNKR